MESVESCNEKVILEFLDKWSASNVDALMPYFREDAVYADIPYDTRRGIEEIRNFIEASFKVIRIKIEVLNIASKRNVVFTERIEHLEFLNPYRRGDYPLVGVFELEDGLISRWTEYFDGRMVEGTKVEKWPEIRKL
jgi:limonene-1,2-epoxide hydrolase